jgi:hypothetical protein
MTTDNGGRHPVTRKRVVYDVPGTAVVKVKRGVAYAGAGSRTLTLYYPPSWDGAATPAVVFVMGLGDERAKEVLGCRISEMESYISWGRLVAASGLVGVTYATEDDPVNDTRMVLEFLGAEGDRLGVDRSRLGIWACSSHVPSALGLMIASPLSVCCAVCCYGFMLDLDGATDVADAQRVWHFANPAAGRVVSDLPGGVPILIARGGRDEVPHVNASIDRFVVHALGDNLPMTLVNHASAPHAFDLDDDSETTRQVVRQVLAFLVDRLSRPGATGR